MCISVRCCSMSGKNMHSPSPPLWALLPGEGHAGWAALQAMKGLKAWCRESKIKKLKNLLGSINVIQLGGNEGGGVFFSNFFHSISDMHILCEDFIPKKERLSSHPLPMLKFLSMPNDSMLDSTTSFQKTDAKMSPESECQPGWNFMLFLVYA